MLCSPPAPLPAAANPPSPGASALSRRRGRPPHVGTIAPAQRRRMPARLRSDRGLRVRHFEHPMAHSVAAAPARDERPIQRGLIVKSGLGFGRESAVLALGLAPELRARVPSRAAELGTAQHSPPGINSGARLGARVAEYRPHPNLDRADARATSALNSFVHSSGARSSHGVGVPVQACCAK